MKSKIYQEKIYGYVVEEHLEIYFEYDDTIVYSTDEKVSMGNDSDVYEGQVIKMVSVQGVETFYGIMEMGRLSKSEILSIQDIITFFTGVPFIEYCGYSKSEGISPIKVNKKELIFKVGQKDYTSDLKILLNKIKQEKKLVISLLDRWRKAIYLIDESVDANLYHDEAILSFFHIIELLSEVNKNELFEKMSNEINSMLYNFYNKNLKYNDNQINEKINGNRKILNDILIGNELNLSQKIKYFLDKIGLYDEIVSNFVDNIIKIRNSIAHGREIYNSSVCWPLPPFFNLADNSYKYVDLLYSFTARMVACYIGVECWKDEWLECKKKLLPSKNIFSDYLKNYSNYVDITVQSLYEGNKYNITWDNIFEMYVNDHQKYNIEVISNAFKECFLNTIMNPSIGICIFNISVVLCDSVDSEVSNKAKENVVFIIENNLIPWGNKKDIYGYLNHYNITPIWYKNYLVNGK